MSTCPPGWHECVHCHECVPHSMSYTDHVGACAVTIKKASKARRSTDKPKKGKWR